MIAAALALFLIQSTPVAASDPGDIVVTREKLRKLRLDADIDRAGTLHGCKVIVSSGDAGIDQQACVSVAHCTAQGQRSSETMADCVDAELIAYVDTSNHGPAHAAGHADGSGQ